MRIARIETFVVPPRWLFVRIETDDGVVGWGEPIVEGRAATVRAAVNELSELLIGADPRSIESHWQRMTKGGFYRGGPILSSAVAGLDQALWDILGKSLDVPIHVLLGGAVRDRVRVYGWIGGDDPAEVAHEAEVAASSGLTAIKMNASGVFPVVADPRSLDEVVERVARARAAVGDGVDIAIDFHGRVGVADARRLMQQLQPLRPLFIEEPVVPELAHRLSEVVAASPVPVAAGERIYSRADALPLLQAGVAVLQPDLSHAGGISEVRRIAALAEVWGVPLAPHSPLGPLALASCLQVDFATPNFLIQEQSLGIHYHEGVGLLDYVVDAAPFAIIDGHIGIWYAPGLGVEIDEAAVRDLAVRGHDWHSPIWNHSDGSFAEW